MTYEILIHHLSHSYIIAYSISILLVILWNTGEKNRLLRKKNDEAQAALGKMKYSTISLLIALTLYVLAFYYW